MNMNIGKNMEFHKQMVAKYGLPSWLPKNWIYKKARDSLKKPIFGVGINDVEFSCQPTTAGISLRYPAYEVWYSMLQRSHSELWKSKWPTYKLTSCSKEWIYFSNFLSWFYKSNYRPGYDLDKDLLSECNTYSENTCIFLPKEINYLFRSKRSNSTDSLPIGVYLANNGSIRSSISNKAYNSVEEARLEHTKYILDKLQVYKDKYADDNILCLALDLKMEELHAM